VKVWKIKRVNFSGVPTAPDGFTSIVWNTSKPNPGWSNSSLKDELNTKYYNSLNQSAKNMIEFASGIDVNINLIPWNPVESLPFTEPSRNECMRFVERLEKAGLNVTLRTRRGREIGGACGQLGKTLSDKIIDGKKL